MAKKADDGQELSADDKFELLLASLTEALTKQQTPGIDAEALKDILQANSTAVQKAMKPENAFHPGISALSYPEGDRARPREGILKYEFFYNNFPVTKFPESHHWRELELAAQVQPGEFTVLRKDLSKMTVTVKGERNADQQLTKVSVTFPISREEKWLVPPMSVVLYQLVYPDNPRRRFVEAMQEQLNLMLGEPIPAAV